tara:strand:+ start:449 stop:808 length:360 start_codon:yes stop_codon:yes gene_type:complete
MKTYFINAEQKQIKEITLFKDNVNDNSLWLDHDKIRENITLLLDTDFIEVMPYDDGAFICYKSQDNNKTKHWISIEGRYRDTKIISGNAVLMNLNVDNINMEGINFLEDYDEPVSDFVL